MKKEEKLKLTDGEKILVKTNVITSKSLRIFPYAFTLFFILSGVLFFIFNAEAITTMPHMFLSPFLFFVMFLFVLFPIIGFYMIYKSVEQERTLFYITSKRVVKFTPKNIVSRSSKIYDIEIPEIAHLMYYYDSLEIAPKPADGTFHYKVKDVEIKRKLKNVKIIWIKLDGDEGETVKSKIRSHLVELVPLIEHPNIKFLYLNSQTLMKK